MSLRAYDGAYDRNLVAACKAKGAVAMSHYVSRSYAGTSAQPADVLAAGMGCVFNWEGLASELVGETRAQGAADAREALATIPAAVPRDGTVNIYYSVDVDLTDLSVVDQAFLGVNDAHAGTGIGVGVYGEGGLILRLHAKGLVSAGWLSMSEGFGGFQTALTSGLVAIVQMHDAYGNWLRTDVPNTDINTVLDPLALGAWWPAGSPYAQGADMPLSDADVQKVVDGVWQRRLTLGSGPGAVTASAAAFLVNADGFAAKASHALLDTGGPFADLMAKVEGLGVTVDTAAIAAAIRDKLTALINGTPA